jgi:hypothetical protein
MQVGDFKLNLNGVLSGGYSGTYGNLIDSSHGLNFGGNGTLSGSFYDPNFLNFALSPYYDQAQSNSSFQSIFHSTGFNFSSGIFSGSNFPGSVSYSRAYNSQGTFAVPGLADFTTHGNSSNFGINWGEHVPDWPSLSVGFQKSGNEYNVLGSPDNGTSDNRSFNLNSGYRVLGFNLGAFYANAASNAQIPQVLGAAQEISSTQGGSSGYGFSASHAIPLRGSWSGSFSRSDSHSDYLGYKYDATVDTVSSSAGIQPTNKLHAQVSTTYSDNLTGLLYQSLIPTGSAFGGFNQNQSSSSNAFAVNGSVSYAVLPNLLTQGFVERRTQTFLGQGFGANSYGGGVGYTRDLMGGGFSSSFSISQNTLDNSDLSTTGFTASVNYTRPIYGWVTSGSFSYAQNAQTLLITYMNSYYTYSGLVRRNFSENLSWSASAGGSRTGLTSRPGTDSSSQSYTTGLTYSHWVSGSASYSKSSGQGLLGGIGLTPVPLPPVIPPELLILYGGESYSFSVSSSPIRGFTAAAAYAKARSNTINAGIGSWNKNEQWNAQIQYQFRKMYFTGGYTRLLQGFSASGTSPLIVSSFNVGVSRWFNFF